MENNILREGDLLEVGFIDVVESCVWTPLEIARCETCPECKVFGRFLNEDDKIIRLMLSISSDGDCSFTLIPKGLITTIHRLNVEEPNESN